MRLCLKLGIDMENHNKVKEKYKYAFGGICESFSLLENDVNLNQEPADIQKTDTLFPPPDYNVIIYDDNFTPFDAVTLILQEVFYKSNEEAIKIARNAELNGKTVVGIYTYDIGLSKINQAMAMAEAVNFPLKFSLEKI